MDLIMYAQKSYTYKPYITHQQKGLNSFRLNEFINTLYHNKSIKISYFEAFVIISNIIKSLKLSHFNFADEDIIKNITQYLIDVKRNGASFKFSKDKNKDLELILTKYNEFLQKNNLADIAEVEKAVLEYVKNNKIEVFSDIFENENIHFFQSKLQKEIFKHLIKTPKINTYSNTPNQYIIKSYNKFDEVKNALKIVRDLAKTKQDLKNILIITTDIDEYYPIFEVLFDEYGLNGYSTKGIKKKYLNIDIQNEIALIIDKLKRLNLSFDKKQIEKEILESRVVIKNDGLVITETNQIYHYEEFEHIIFVGADTTKFPPTRKKHLFWYSEFEKDFYLNNLYKFGVDIYQNIKKRAKNLYIIYSQYDKKVKKELSFIIDKDLLPYKPKFNSELDNYKNLKKVMPEFDFRCDIKDIEVKTLSASKINTYLKCPREYFYKYELNIEPPKEQTNEMEATLQGSIMHKAFELIVKDYPKINPIHHYIKLAYNDSEIKDKLKGDIFEEIYKIKLEKLIENFIDYLQEIDVTNSKTELLFYLDKDLKIGNKDNYFIKGFIDRIDINDEITIIDYKSKKVTNLDKDKINQILELKDVQLGLYIYWAKQMYNKKVNANLLSFNTDKGYSYFASIKECDKIEFKRNIPQFACYNNEYEQKLKKTIFDTKNNIENKLFDYDNSDEEHCQWCEYNMVCRILEDKKGV